jgi:hypothetical protein
MKRLVTMTVLVILAAGCQQTPSHTLVPRVQPFLNDVPVPTTFTFDPQHSSDLSGEGTEGRFASYYYTGRAYFTDVVTFYKRNMLTERWQLKQEEGTPGQKKLVFEKTVTTAQVTRPTRCQITIIAKGEYATGIQILRIEP